MRNKDIVLKAYILNILQVLSMGVFNIVVPIVVGFDNYGYYISVFAVPGFSVALLETRFLIGSDKTVNILNVVLLLFAASVANLALLGFDSIVFTVIIFCILFFRSTVYVFIVKLSSPYFKSVYIKSELFSLVIFIGSFLFVYISGVFNLYSVFLFFVIQNLSFSLCGLFLLFKVMKKSRNSFVFPMTCFQISRVSFGFRQLSLMCNYRLFEDFIFTFSPLLLSLSGGNYLAGVYKYYTSILKLCIKLYPIRYETYFDFCACFNKVKLRRLLCFNFIVSAFIFICSYFIFIMVTHEFIWIDSIKLDYGFLSMLVISPFLAFVIAAFPNKINENKNIITLQAVTLISLGVFSQLYNEIYGFLVSIITLIYFSFFYSNLSKNIKR